MKEKRLKNFSILLSICLLLTLLPITATAEELHAFTFKIYDENTATKDIYYNEAEGNVFGANGTVEVIRDGLSIQKAEIVESTTNPGTYSAMIDVAGLQDTDGIKITCWAEDSYYVGGIIGNYIGVWKNANYTNLSSDLSNYVCIQMTPTKDDGIRAWNDIYQVENMGSSIYVGYNGSWNEEKVLEAIGYVGVDEILSLNLYTTGVNFKSLPANIVKEISSKEDNLAAFWFDNAGVTFYSLKGNSDIKVTVGDKTNVSINKKLAETEMKDGYVIFTLSGDVTFDDSRISYRLPDELVKKFTITNPTEYEDEYSKVKETEKYIYSYNAQKNIFELLGPVIYQYMYYNDGEVEGEDYTIIIPPGLVRKCGSYIVTDSELDPILTTEALVNINTINASMTTTEVSTTVSTALSSVEEGKIVEVALPKAMNLGEDAMQKASETNTPIVFEVSETGENSFVNWSFGKVDNPVEFNPSVHVDAAIADVDTKLEGVELPETLTHSTVSFEFEGQLPGKAEVTLEMGSSDLGITNTPEGGVVYLYYYNPQTNTFELVDESAVTDSYATFNMTHCSDYVVTSEKLPSSATTQQTPPTNDGIDSGTADNGAIDNGETGENAPISPATGEESDFVLCITFMGVCVIVAALRKHIMVKIRK